MQNYSGVGSLTKNKKKLIKTRFRKEWRIDII